MNDNFDLDGLPESFSMRGEDGSFTHIKDPVYNLIAPGFYGDTWFDEGEIIRTRIIPNETMQPLNLAAAAAYKNWMDSLPLHGIAITIDDTVEAAMMLRNDPALQGLSHDQASQAVMSFALKLKKKREDKGGMSIPSQQMGTQRAASSKAPAMPNTRFVQANERPGAGSRETTVLHEPRRQTSVAQRAMGSMPQPARNGA